LTSAIAAGRVFPALSGFAFLNRFAVSLTCFASGEEDDVTEGSRFDRNALEVQLQLRSKVKNGCKKTHAVCDVTGEGPSSEKT
jgi:hypothetical protein